MKTISEIYDDINARFYNKSSIDVEKGTAIDSYILSSSEGIELAYQEIENNKNPYFFTNASGSDLDSWGIMMRLPREVGESDENYKYRLMNWTLINESSNLTAITAALLNLTYASHAEYVPMVYGCGTAGVYIIPTTYDTDTIARAIEEVKGKLGKVTDPSDYTEYIIPAIKKTKVVVSVNFKGDADAIKASLTDKIKTYINSIPVKDYLSVGEINKIGINETGVGYFSVGQVIIDNSLNNNLEILQELNTKFMFDEIIWWVVEN